MAPPKTAVLSQQQQQQQQQGDLHVKQQQAAAKPRKRKAKQAQQSVQFQSSLVEQPPKQQQQQQQQQQNSQQVSKPVVPSALDVQKGCNSVKVVSVVSNEQQQKQLASVVPSERTTLKKQQQPNQVPPSPVKEISVVSSKRVAATTQLSTTVPASASPVSVIGKHHQISTEEADDVDAGIELDGSSNSGSSVKDMNEDQMKSTSVSPVMAQSNLVNEPGAGVNVKQVTSGVAEVAPVEQLTETICSDASPIVKKTTKQQLAANQQVIDADEQQLQEKLQNKQRKSSSSQDSCNNTTSNEDNSQNGDRTKSSIGQQNNLEKSSSGRMRRSFSSQSSQEDASLCKVCEQHVYQMEKMMAEKSIYHKRCFRCHQCKIQLRVDNYSSHEGRVYCKAHHRQIFQPQIKLDKEDDVDIVAKSTAQTVDDYLLHRGRLSELSFSFLNPKPEGILKRQMIICENEPAELPKDVVRSDTKVDDGIDQLNLNLNNILERFERGTANNKDEEDQPSSAGVVIEKPSFNIKQTLMAFESKLVNSGANESIQGHSNKSEVVTERPVVKKLTNNNVFLNRQNSQDNNNEQSTVNVKPLVVRRSESLMMRLKKYESRIAGEHVDDEDSGDGDENGGNNKDDNSITTDLSQLEGDEGDDKRLSRRRAQRPKKLTSIDLSSLKNQWENGDILKRRNEEEENEVSRNSEAGDSSPSVEKNEELMRIRQQLAQKKLGESGPIRNIYENAIKDAQLQQKQQASRRDSSDLSALNGFSTNIIQKQLLQNSFNGSNSSNNYGQDSKTPTTLNKDHFQLNLNKKANKLKEKFELGLITNSSRDDSDISDGEEGPELTKLEQIRQEKLEDLSIFTDGQIKSREARNLFQQIDRRISAANGGSSSQQPKVVNSRSLASVGTPMRTKLTNKQMNASNGLSATSNHSNHHPQRQEQELEKQQPIRLTNNVRI